MASRDYFERHERPPYVPTPDSLSYDEGAFKDIEKSLPIEKCTAIPTLQESTPIDDTPDGGLHAWLVLFGVSFSSVVQPVIFSITVFHRPCALPSRRANSAFLSFHSSLLIAFLVQDI